MRAYSSGYAPLVGWYDECVSIPVRNPHLFSPDINRQVLANGNLYFLLRSAIKALPYVEQHEHREDLKRACAMRSSFMG
jgi:hypothetical protein